MPGGSYLHTIHDGTAMHPTLRWSVDQAEPFAVIRMSGVLTGSSAAVAHAAIARCLAAQPAAVLVDVTDLRIDEPTATTVFAVGARDAAAWPGVGLSLCCRDRALAERLRHSAVLRFVPVHTSVEEAVNSVNGMAPAQLRTRLMPVVGAARQAREVVTEACARWGLPDLVGPACTVVTELVNNVVVHASTPMEVVVRLRDRHLHVSVTDGSPTPPEAKGPAAPTAPGGRGLMMVDAVSDRWGWTPLEGGGKAVWAILRTDETW
jgi:anti-sigma regulatory factor (Ser/Thr protein kinase)